MKETRKRKISPKLKKAFIENLRKCKGLIVSACKRTNICYNTYRAMRDEDPNFAEECDTTIIEVGELVENALFKAIGDGDLTAIIFYLKTKGKILGYSERTEVTGANGTPLFKNVETKSDAEIQTEIDKIRKARGEE